MQIYAVLISKQQLLTILIYFFQATGTGFLQNHFSACLKIGNPMSGSMTVTSKYMSCSIKEHFDQCTTMFPFCHAFCIDLYRYRKFQKFTDHFFVTGHPDKTFQMCNQYTEISLFYKVVYLFDIFVCPRYKRHFYQKNIGISDSQF